MKMKTISDIDLLMIGKTGNGKSALGNAILKRKKFVSRSSSSSVTKQIDYEVSEYKGKVIKVVDGPGVGDTRLNSEGSVQLVVQAMEQAMAANTRGYHAFLLVVRFGGRFTVEDQDTIAFLKNIFGKDFVRRFCILVMTCGDNFEREAEDTGITFDQWCSEQKGVFQELLKECDYRVLLFDNVTRDEEKRNRQIDQLLHIVNNLQVQGYRYTDENFELAQAAREKAIVESKKPMIREEILQETSLILQKLEEVRQNFEREEQIPSLKKLLTRCDELIKTLQDQDKGTGALRDLEESVVSVRKSVDEAIRVQTTVAEERRRMEAKEKEMREKMEQEMQRQRQQFEEMMAQQRKTEEERREMEKELDKKRREMEEERSKAREAREQELIAQLAKERELFQKQSQELQKAYRDTREKADGGWLGKVVGFVRKVALLGRYLGPSVKASTCKQRCIKGTMSQYITDIDLLLIGKTGNGKSALGNAILKRKAFFSKASTESVTTEISYEVSEYKGKIIKVVDGPGVGDTRLNTEGSAKLVLRAMEQAMVANTRGYHAFLLVVRFGGRFTVEDQDVIQFLKSVFGQDFVRRFCILVMTCGDNFEREEEDTGITFEQWCREEGGVFQELLKECDYRVVLFDNYTKDEVKRNAQIDQLLCMVSNLQARGHRYTDKNFELARAARHRAIVESKKPEISEKIFQETSLILQRLDGVKQNIHDQREVPMLQHLLARCDSLIAGLRLEDGGTGALLELDKQVSVVRRSVEEVIQIHSFLAEERRRREARESDLRAQHNLQLQQQQQYYHNLIANQNQAHQQARQADYNNAVQHQQQASNAQASSETREQQLQAQLEEKKEEVQQQTQELSQVYTETRAQSDQTWIGKVVGFVKWVWGKIRGN
ncbi:immune-associated nucleotide-binding protein 9 [Plakobranchus ocellatus]|uniref:Immune-associated nucleotide-binding protein 9 n=1 Tax=Plakobranchus ocellatus TaxID=259542 RepID=A0AAV3YAM7_9GAST|nr:immune-associated nucleotide-binding protein 9 [Plakobranchus ocellatus]